MPPRIPQKIKFRTGVAATAFGVSIFVGTITGAWLKEDQQKEEGIKQFRETSPSVQIAMLESQRNHLEFQRGQLQRKLDAFKDRVKKREEEKLAQTTK